MGRAGVNLLLAYMPSPWWRETCVLHMLLLIQYAGWERATITIFNKHKDGKVWAIRSNTDPSLAYEFKVASQAK